MIMPKVDMDQETGTVVEWLKTEGQQVKEGETILVIETDKIAIDVESPGTGTLAGISAHPGDVIPIGTVIAYILEEGEELPEAPAEPPPLPEPVEEQAPGVKDEVSATPVARKMAASHDLDLSALTPTGKGGKVTKEDVQSALDSRKKPQPDGKDGKVVASPAARRKARLKGVDLRQVRGTGPGGRIQAIDIENFQPSSGLPAPSPARGGEKVPMVGMRRTIAERLTESYQSIPHIQFTASADMTNFNQARQDYNDLAELRGDGKVSVTALMIKIVAMTLAEHPWLNSSLLEEEILLHEEINIGLAVALEEGLIVPVINQANQKGIRKIAEESTDLITRAREGALTNPDVKGATFTISNLGPFGVEQFNAIINPPEVGILAIGATRPEVVPVEKDAIAIRPIMRFTLSADHRVVDGAVAARFIADLKAKLENPIFMNY